MLAFGEAVIVHPGADNSHPCADSDGPESKFSRETVFGVPSSRNTSKRYPDAPATASAATVSASAAIASARRFSGAGSWLANLRSSASSSAVFSP